MFRIFREGEGGRDYLYADISTREIVVENIYPRLTDKIISFYPYILTFILVIFIDFTLSRFIEKRR